MASAVCPCEILVKDAREFLRTDPDPVVLDHEADAPRFLFYAYAFRVYAYPCAGLPPVFQAVLQDLV